MLKGNHPPVSKRYGLVRVADRRDVGVIKRIVKRTAEEYETAASMGAKYSNPAEPAEPAAPAPSSIRTAPVGTVSAISISTVSITGSRCVNPRFGLGVAHCTPYLLVRRAPREPDRILW